MVVMETYIERCLAGKTRSDSPFYCFSCGGPVSGKGLPAKMLVREGHENFALINMDIMRGAPDYERLVGQHYHPEKQEATILEFYRRAQAIVAEAAARGISVVFEDHGDYPEAIRRQLALVRAEGYETFLAANSCSPENLTVLANDDKVRPWTMACHRRFYDAYPALKKEFDAGILLEKLPAKANKDHQFGLIARYTNDHGNVTEEILDDERYTAFHGWKNTPIDPAETAAFDRVDGLMAGAYPEPRNAGALVEGGRSEGFWQDITRGPTGALTARLNRRADLPVAWAARQENHDPGLTNENSRL